MKPLACTLSLAALLAVGPLSGSPTSAQEGPECTSLPDQMELQVELSNVVAAGNNGGLGNHMWATVVNRDGLVCTVAFSGDDNDDQWPGSRVISAQKANTANAFSLPEDAGGKAGFALSTANLWTAVQPGGSLFVGTPPVDVLPGGSLFGLQFSNPINTEVAYAGPAEDFGQENDPMVGGRIGGVNVFGGGLALYGMGGEVVGALGVSGDTSCTDHIIAWKVRDALELDNVPGGVSPTGDDNIIHDLEISPSSANGNAVSPSGFGHPECDPDATAIAEDLPNAHQIGPNDNG